LEKVTLPDTIESIGASAFEGCEKLEKIAIPASVISIGKNAFKDTDLNSVKYNGNAEQWNAVQIAGGNDLLIEAAGFSAGACIWRQVFVQ